MPKFSEFSAIVRVRVESNCDVLRSVSINQFNDSLVFPDVILRVFTLFFNTIMATLKALDKVRCSILPTLYYNQDAPLHSGVHLSTEISSINSQPLEFLAHFQLDCEV